MRISNDTVEILLADAFGPRVLEYGLCGEASVFGSGEDVRVSTPGGVWTAYGGHRMWLAPETIAETYRIDDAPPTIVREGAYAALAEHVRDPRGFRTALHVELDAEGSGVTVTHRARNESQQPQVVAPWALTIVRPGGRFVIPLCTPKTHAEAKGPAATIALWPYAALRDPRVTWADETIESTCDERFEEPWKIGASGERGWCAYIRGDTAFVKRFTWSADSTYPDRGCAIEVFTKGRFGELETLGPIACVEPGATIAHVERWSLVRVPGGDASAALLREFAR